MLTEHMSYNMTLRCKHCAFETIYFVDLQLHLIEQKERNRAFYVKLFQIGNTIISYFIIAFSCCSDQNRIMHITYVHTLRLNYHHCHGISSQGKVLITGE